MTKSQITELLADLKVEADKQNVEIDDSFVQQLQALRQEGMELSIDPEKVNDTLGKLARSAFTEASDSDDARVGARPLIMAYARDDNPWKL